MDSVGIAESVEKPTLHVANAVLYRPDFKGYSFLLEHQDGQYHLPCWEVPYDQWGLEDHLKQLVRERFGFEDLQSAPWSKWRSGYWSPNGEDAYFESIAYLFGTNSDKSPEGYVWTPMKDVRRSLKGQRSTEYNLFLNVLNKGGLPYRSQQWDGY
ncbi:MAG: hypothetical protein ACLFO2_01105 [Candidatus Woesearchaeota archaeon]